MRDTAPHLVEHGRRGAASRPTADDRDHAEVAGEAAAVLDLHEGAHALETGVSLDAADRAHVSGHERRRLLARPGDHHDVVRQAREGVAGEIRRAARDVDTRMRTGRAGRGLARLSNPLVRDAASVHDRDVCALVGALFDVTVCKQALTDFLRVRMGHLAAEKTNRERRHRRDANCTQNTASRRLVMIRSPAAARDATQVPEAG